MRCWRLSRQLLDFYVCLGAERGDYRGLRGECKWIYLIGHGGIRHCTFLCASIVQEYTRAFKLTEACPVEVIPEGEINFLCATHVESTILPRVYDMVFSFREREEVGETETE